MNILQLASIIREYRKANIAWYENQADKCILTIHILNLLINSYFIGSRTKSSFPHRAKGGDWYRCLDGRDSHVSVILRMTGVEGNISFVFLNEWGGL